MFQVITSFRPLKLVAASTIDEPELLVAFRDVLAGTPDGEEAEDLLVQLFFSEGYFKTDVERARAFLRVLELIETNTITVTPSVELEDKGTPA